MRNVIRALVLLAVLATTTIPAFADGNPVPWPTGDNGTGTIAR